MYNDKVLEHFQNPRNIGEIEDADGIGIEGDPGCGDYIKLYIKVKDNRLIDVKIKVHGCAAAIATGSTLTELAIGKYLDDAMMIHEDDVLEALGGLPEEKAHCSNLGVAALKEAIWDYVFRSNLKKQD
ncbi:iron-sulfur cluster assembly scaffold protein [Desulfolucanica intricata]|uniref:iron-sulfur cluster assembly scaffold protein n=1 Tax=Desulfolucanica intricata TaxID=1285191 RepID=UPI00082BD553|nr:iron-sulfur cluster assembly scaffold protein [Desulfolucanica intricata]